MITSLYISNYALISQLQIDFNTGMTVITGETGAGKSIIIGAIGLISGQRADTKAIKEGAEKSIVEVTIDMTQKQLTDFFEKNDLDYQTLTTIRREITTNGKSRAFVNDTPVSLNILKQLTNQFIDIHSQHENLLLSNENYQLSTIDIVANNQSAQYDYQIAFDDWRQKKKIQAQIQQKIEKQTADIDYISYQYQQIADTNLQPTEQNELETEQALLGNVEEIKNQLQRINISLNNDHQDTIAILKESTNTLYKIKDHLPDAQQWAERMESLWIELKDIVDTIENTQEQLEYNPQRLNHVNNRLSTIYELQTKFKVENIQQLIDLQNNLKQQIDSIDNADETLRIAQKEVEKAYEKMKQKAQKLTQTRKNAIPTIEKHLISQLLQLGMPHIQFQVNLAEEQSFDESGSDKVTFLFSANKNRSLQPISETASGGEIARFMLALKSLLVSNANLPTIIFDEIDTGVSGEIAEKMGEIMQTMSRETQVIVITHLPQIASKGAKHFKVFKETTDKETITQIKPLDTTERINEIAQMLSGKAITDAAITNARELLKI